MAIAICSKCYKYTPDGFHDWNLEEICSCRTKQEWIDYYKRRKWYLKIDGKTYDFTEDKNG